MRYANSRARAGRVTEMVLPPSGPPDTSAYYHVAYAWAAVLYAGYAILLWSRSRRVRERLRVTGGGQSDRDA